LIFHLRQSEIEVSNANKNNQRYGEVKMKESWLTPEIFAILTAICWGVGGFFEKKGLQLGNLSPQMGITIRTVVALVILAVVSFPQWKTVTQASPKALLYMIIGGGIVAGAAGMLCFYTAIKGAPLSRVMPIAFTSPFFGALMGILFAGDPITAKTIIGMLMTTGGIIVLTIG
jgi:transporter family protein